MKTILSLSLAAAVSASAAIVVPGANGTDGALNITADTVIDLGLAPAGLWNNDNTANAGKGVYDAAKWAVVFKYSSVSVATGATVTFKNNASRAPVVWLVSGNVMINGTVKLNGQNSVDIEAPRLAEPGPGGFRGGNTAISGGVGAGAGFGPGGGAPQLFDGRAGSGSYGSVGSGSSVLYGNPSLVPLLGGSGGGGHDGPTNSWKDVGGGGGGALLLASSGNMIVNGLISAKGGNDSPRVWSDGTGAGSGGIRLIAEVLNGTGQLSAVGGLVAGGHPPSGNGRIRLERVTNTNTIAVVPAPSVVDLAAGATVLLWPPAGAPEVKIISLGGQFAPADPKSGFGTIGADVSIPTATTTTAIIETTNVEQASQVKVRITPRDTYNFTEVDATYASTVSPGVLRWTATLTKRNFFI